MAVVEVASAKWQIHFAMAREPIEISPKSLQLPLPLQHTALEELLVVEEEVRS